MFFSPPFFSLSCKSKFLALLTYGANYNKTKTLHFSIPHPLILKTKRITSHVGQPLFSFALMQSSNFSKTVKALSKLLRFLSHAYFCLNLAIWNHQTSSYHTEYGSLLKGTEIEHMLEFENLPSVTKKQKRLSTIVSIIVSISVSVISGLLMAKMVWKTVKIRVKEGHAALILREWFSSYLMAANCQQLLLLKIANY